MQGTFEKKPTWSIIESRLGSPDLTLFDCEFSGRYSTFPQNKNSLTLIVSKKHSNFFAYKPMDFYMKGIKQLPERWKNDIKSDGKIFSKIDTFLLIIITNLIQVLLIFYLIKNFKLVLDKPFSQCTRKSFTGLLLSINL